MRIDNDNVIAIWLKAREASEAAHVVVFTSPNDAMYEDRLLRVRERVSELLSALEVQSDETN